MRSAYLVCEVHVINGAPVVVSADIYSSNAGNLTCDWRKKDVSWITAMEGQGESYPEAVEWIMGYLRGVANYSWLLKLVEKERG